jgi:hypothetical protein
VRQIHGEVDHELILRQQVLALIRARSSDGLETWLDQACAVRTCQYREARGSVTSKSARSHRATPPFSSRMWTYGPV